MHELHWTRSCHTCGDGCQRNRRQSVIIRGLRNIADFEYEYQIGTANQRLCKRDRTWAVSSVMASFLISSATILKEVAQFGRGWLKRGQPLKKHVQRAA